MITLSTVTPVYSGEKYIKALVQNIHAVRQSWEDMDAPIQMVESIFVDDGSTDKSSDILTELAEKHPWIKIVTLSRNFGQHIATIAGICHSSGDWIVTLDEDMQHDPVYIEEMLKKAVQCQADIVYAKPVEKKVHGGYWRDQTSTGIKNMLSSISGVKHMTLFNSFRLLRGGIARAAASSASSQTYLDVALTWFSSSIVSVDIRLNDERYKIEGESGYSLLKLIDHARKLIISSNVDFPRWGFFLGAASILFSVFLAAWVFVGHFILPETIKAPGWASLLAAIAMLSGTIIALLTMTLEYVSIMVVNHLGKPVFFTVDRASDRVLLGWFENLNVSDNSTSKKF